MSAESVALAVTRLQTEEGFRSLPYRDIYGNETVGYGCNLAAGISRKAALALLSAQTQEIDQALQTYTWYSPVDAVRQSVFIDVAVNEGLHGLLRFPRMLAAIPAAIATGDWNTVAVECAVEDPRLDISRYAPLRAILLSGKA